MRPSRGTLSVPQGGNKVRLEPAVITTYRKDVLAFFLCDGRERLRDALMTTRKCFGTLVTVLTAGLVLFIIPVCNAFPTEEETKRELFSPVTDRGSVKLATGPTVMRARFVNINFGLLSVPTEPSEEHAGTTNALRLNLYEDVTLNAVLDRIERRTQDSFTWFGHIQGTETSQVTLVVEREVMVGNIRVRGALYQVRYVGEGTHVIYQINAQAFPPDSEPLETR